ncbi:hypothetical protein THRCLA_03529 [Thraustotheca clavata]|uniref:FYVE-type domain-containing protein n=1 Tax=Thraustotheca clavata TaxID=74557 RepID=A0A1W0A1T8_9STRA|nr:hypothetical protein THRCLA_03529 [Thraustotheca clavata]
MQASPDVLSVEEFLDLDVGITTSNNSARTAKWQTPALLPTENERLAHLQSYNILDTPPERVFDVICELASNVLKCPMAGISFIDEDREWFKARIGWVDPEIPRNIALCSLTITSNNGLAIMDVTKDKKFATNPLVQSSPGIKFYAGWPILDSSGLALGTVCVFDFKPHSEADMATLEKLAHVAMMHLEDRKNTRSPDSDKSNDTSTLLEHPVISMNELLRSKECIAKKDRVRCAKCARMFSWFRHKKQCRACGDVFCSFCSVAKRAKQRHGPAIFKVFICLTCINIGSVLGHFKLCPDVRDSLRDADCNPVLSSYSITKKELEQIQRLEEQDLLTPHRLARASECIPFDERGCCHVCNRGFNIFRSKHTCRVCGDIVCFGCSKKKLAKFGDGLEMEPITVCIECIISLTNKALQVELSHEASGCSWMLANRTTLDLESYQTSRQQRSSMISALDTVKSLLLSVDDRSRISSTSLPSKQQIV